MIRLTLLTLLLFISAAYSDNYAVITTSDGQKFEGAVYSKDNSIEWRKDIYEMKDEQGENETFILKPEYTGKLNMANIAEIQRISKQSMPQNIITLTNDVKARLLLKYLIKLKNGNISNDIFRAPSPKPGPLPASWTRNPPGTGKIVNLLYKPLLIMFHENDGLAGKTGCICCSSTARKPNFWSMIIPYRG